MFTLIEADLEALLTFEDAKAEDKSIILADVRAWVEQT